MPKKKQEYYEDEIDLADYIRVLIKRKVTVISVFLIAVIAAAAYNFTAPRVYQAQATLSVAKIDEPLISAQRAKKALTSRTILQPVAAKLPDLTVKKLRKNLKIDILKDAGLIDLTFTYTNPQRAVKILQGITISFINKANRRYQQKIGLIRKQLSLLFAQKQAIKEQVNNLVTQEAGENIGAYAIMQNAVSNYHQTYSELAREFFRLQQRLDNAQGFALAEAPAADSKPLKPKPAQNISIAAVLGLMLGIFIAFWQEFWEKSMKKDAHR
jgi:capsular polysaccharide biosynthesis protein